MLSLLTWRGPGTGSLNTPVKTVRPCQATFFGKPTFSDNNVPTAWVDATRVGCGSRAIAGAGAPVLIGPLTRTVTRLLGAHLSRTPRSVNDHLLTPGRPS